MIDIFFDYFGYDKEHHFVAGIGYEYVIILNLISRIITINRINIIVCRGFVHFMLGDDGFLGENPFGTCLICARGRDGRIAPLHGPGAMGGAILPSYPSPPAVQKPV